MSGLTLAVVIQAAFLATGSEDYSDAHRVVTKTGIPMVVMVGADWCPACETMKQRVIPEVKKRGLLRRVAFATVNLDREQKLGRELTGGGPIPQLIMFRKTEKGWLRKRLIGNQSLESIEHFINEGLQQDEATRGTQPASVGRPSQEAPLDRSASRWAPDGRADRG